MIATMVHGDPDPEDLRKFFRALQRAQRDIDLRPELYTHYYKKEFPVRYHDKMDTRRWGPGERLVFDTYTEDAYRAPANGSRSIASSRPAIWARGLRGLCVPSGVTHYQRNATAIRGPLKLSDSIVSPDFMS